MKSGSRRFKCKGGFILLSVLFAVTILLTTATAFAWYARNEGKRVESMQFILRMRSTAEYALSMISEKIGEDGNGYDSIEEPLYRSSGIVIDMGDYKIEALIEPLDDKIPISGILLPDGVTPRKEYEYAWERIWDYLKQPDLAAVVLDFMDKDQKQKLGGSERKESINRPVSDMSELKRLPEIDDGVLWGTKDIPGGLGMFLTIYGKEKVNFNTASAAVLSILDKGIDMSLAETIVAERLKKPLKNGDDLKKILGFPEALVTKLTNITAFKSEYLRVKMKVIDFAGRERNYRVVLRRDGGGCSICRWEE